MPHEFSKASYKMARPNPSKANYSAASAPSISEDRDSANPNMMTRDMQHNVFSDRELSDKSKTANGPANPDTGKTSGSNDPKWIIR